MFFLNEDNNEDLLSFELGNQEIMIVPIWFIMGLHQKSRQNSQNLNKDTFCWLPLTIAQCFFEMEKYRYAGILLEYDDDDDDYSQGYGLIKDTFKALTKDDIPQPFIDDHEFRSSNVGVDDAGYKLYVFDTGC